MATMSHRSGRHFLQVPGPSNVPDRVLRAMAQPTIDHRGDEFIELAREVLAGLKTVFQTRGPVVVFPASGTGAWEAALVNTLSPGDRVVSFETGEFARLWAEVAKRLGLEVDVIHTGWDQGVDPALVEGVLSADHSQQIRALLIVHNETSTGATSRLAQIRQAIDAAGHPALLLVDAVSSLASIDLRHDEWDVTLTGSQKGLMLPPGLSFNAISDKALNASHAATLPKSYFDWGPMLTANAAGLFPYTPSTNLLYGLREALRMLNEEGLEQVFARHQRLAAAARAAVETWQLPIACRRADEYSAVVTAVMMPEAPGGDRPVQSLPRRRTRPAQGPRLPHRPPRRLQRADAGRHAVRRGDGAGTFGSAIHARRRRCRDGTADGARTGRGPGAMTLSRPVRPQSPRKVGGRLSRKAATPSLKSLLE
jgi:alanine-glyoxylate transaminase/serine-glyoxylate transaminase/serine-pyruvate transaminase